MSAKPPLKKLLELAQKQSDDSVLKLGKLNVKCQEAQQKLDLLIQYRKNYQENLQQASQNGIRHIEWKNYTVFINKLDNAISEQRLAVKHAENDRNIGNDEFNSCQRKLKAYDTLHQHQLKLENQRQNKREQKELDEFTSNRFARNITNTK